MLFTSLLTTALAATGVLAADAAGGALELLNKTAAGSQITWPTADVTIPVNGTVVVQWDWKEQTTPKLMVLLTNQNKTIFHAAGHLPAGTNGLSGLGLYDLKHLVLANETKVGFGPMKPPGDTGINPGEGYQLVLGWENKGQDSKTKPYMLLSSPTFKIGVKGTQELPEGATPWDAKPASAARASVPALAAILAVGLAALL